MLLVFLLLADDLAPLKPRNVTALETLAKSCAQSAGPAKWASVAGGKTDRWAFACGHGEATDITVFSLLPSGQQGVLCDVKGVRGLPKTVRLEHAAAVPLIYVQTLDRTPEQERTIDRVLKPSWGHCTEIAQSDLTHPTDGPTLLEPAGGVRFVDGGFDVWRTISRLYFGEVRRHVATGMRGAHFSDKLEETPIDETLVEALPATWPAALAAHRAETIGWGDDALVRGVKVRIRQAHPAPLVLSLDAGGVRVEWRTDKPQWFSGGTVFGAGLLPQASGDTTREAVVFFEPALPLEKVTLHGGDSALDIISGQIFTDVADIERFEAAED